MESEEGELHAELMRESRNRCIEAEVDTRRTRADRERVVAQILQDDRDFQNKLDELSRVKRQIVQQKEELKLEVAT